MQEPEAAVERVLDQPLDEMIAAHLRACWAWSNSGRRHLQCSLLDPEPLFRIQFWLGSGPTVYEESVTAISVVAFYL